MMHIDGGAICGVYAIRAAFLDGVWWQLVAMVWREVADVLQCLLVFV
jgi:hypothetical protein